MTPTLITLLCLPQMISWDPNLEFVSGTIPIPILYAEPDSMSTFGKSVTIWCQGTLEVKKYHLYKKPRIKAKFSIPSMRDHHAGKYHCKYYSPAGYPLTRLPPSLLGVYSICNLSALPSLLTSEGFDSSILIKEEEHNLSWTVDLQQHPYGYFYAMFPVGPMTPSHRWMFRCHGYDRSNPHMWSASNDPLELLVSELSRNPTLLTQKTFILNSGESLTLQCESEVGYVIFSLSKEGSYVFCQHPGQELEAGTSQADFPLGPVRGSHGSHYRCCGAHSLSSVWLACSELLHILITDELPLLVQPGPRVSPGKDVILLHQPQNQMDTFLLSNKEAVDPPMHFRSKSQAQQHQAEFSMTALTSALGGTYRCYGSQSSFPCLLSQPSDPLVLMVSATPSGSPRLLRTASQAQNYTLENLICMGVAVLVLMVPGILLFETLHSWRRTQDEARR
uniref:Leukocyte immunoglobulin-like receptor subfamily A member 6 n=1 Tax=Castor canadensis TaxID=51338 RepID=A0A8C0WQA7_CASCN